MLTRLEKLIAYIHHTVAGSRRHIYAVGLYNNFGMESSTIRKQTVVCITPELLGINCFVWVGHG